MMFPFLNSSFKQLSRAAEAAEVLDGEYIQHQCKDLQTMDGSMVLLVCRKLHNLFWWRISVVAGNSILCCLVWTLRDMSGMTWFCLRDVNYTWVDHICHLPSFDKCWILSIYQQQNVIARWVDACKWHDLYESWVFIDLPTIKEFLPLDPRHRDEVARGDSRVPERVEISAPKFGDLYKPL